MSGRFACARLGLGVLLTALLGANLFAQPLPEIPTPTSMPAEKPGTPEALPTALPAAATPPTPLAPYQPVAPTTPLLSNAGGGNPIPLNDRPLPGSLLDDFSREYEARRGFRTYTWKGTAITALPNTLLWNPALAVKRDPRMMFQISNQKNYRSDYTLDTWIGGTQALYRIEPEGADVAAQLDIFGVVQTRLSPDDLLLADYRFGLPITARWGWWQGKVAYEHTSAHLGDEQIVARGLIPRSFSKDEIVFGLGRFFGDEQNLRVYGHYAYAFQFVVPGVESTFANRSRFDLGAEWFLQRPTGFAGTPFAAVNFEWRGDQEYTTNSNVQVGWLWRNPFQREGQFRIYAEYYSGRSPYGQFFRNTETTTSVGIAFDY